MADNNGAEGLSESQMEMVLQFQDFTGIDDMTVCRDVLTRHQWQLEVAIQEQLNIREGRPSVYATESRPPTVINDRFMQHIFTSADTTAHGEGREGEDGGAGAGGSFNIFGLVRYIFRMCYNALTSNLMLLLNMFRGTTPDRIVTDPLGDVLNFISAYNEKYAQHPVFYQGTYSQALNDAKRELRFLLVYLHSEQRNAVQAASLCRNALSSPDVIEYINRNMLLWACDVSSPEGYRVSHSINARSYPIMVVVGYRMNKMMIMGRLEGDCSAAELLRRLTTIVTDNEVWLNQARAERLERSFTQSLRQQQDEAYEVSLRADQEKERRRQDELAEQRRLEEEAAAEKRAAEEDKSRIAQLKIDLAAEVPSEPAADEPNTVLFVFKLPSGGGARPERRFRTTDTVRTIYKFIFCHPSSPDRFEITTNFPKRVLYSDESDDAKETTGTSAADRTIAEVGLQNREVLFINDLDA